MFKLLWHIGIYGWIDLFYTAIWFVSCVILGVLSIL